MHGPGVYRLAALVLSLSLSSLAVAAGVSGDVSPPAPPRATAVSVYDGDTFTLSTGDKVRVSGVNTPELKPAEPYGIEAREATAEFVEGEEVDLLYGAVERDGYGRLIGWVRVDGETLEERLLELGLAHVFLIPPVDVGDVDAMLAAQTRAKAARRGIWSTESYQGDLHITSFHANAPGDDRDNVNGEYLRVCNINDRPINLEGYRIVDAAGNSYTFPGVIVPPGHTFKVISGRGEHQGDPAHQLELYLGSATPIWNNGSDRATIYDRYGRVVDSRVHSVKKATR